MLLCYYTKLILLTCLTLSIKIDCMNITIAMIILFSVVLTGIGTTVILYDEITAYQQAVTEIDAKE